MINNDQTQHQDDVETYLAILRQAEQASTAEQWAEAIPLWEQVVRLNSEQSAFWLQLGISRAHAGQPQPAIEAFARVLALGCPFPSPADYEYCFAWRVSYQIACCYAALGDAGLALQWLERSLAQGYRARAALAHDRALALLHDDPRFRELAGLDQRAAPSPAAGWQGDLAWLATEIKRLHYAPFREIGEPAFDAAVQHLHEAIPSMSDPQRLVGVMKLMRRLGDGHSRVAFWLERPEFRAAALTCYWFSEGVFVTAAAPRCAELAGAQVLLVGEHPVAHVLAELDAIISQDNPMWTKLLAPFFLTQPYLLHGLGLIADPATLPLTVRAAAGDTRSVSLPAEGAAVLTTYGFGPPEDWARALPGGPGALPFYLRDAGNYWFEHLAEHGAIYMQYKRVREDPGEPFGAFCERLFGLLDAREVGKLIIDLRRNSGGNTFLHRPLLLGLLQRPQINQRGRLFVIIGRNTFSAAMNGTTIMEDYTNAIFVGEPTGASPNFVGETTLVTLPYTQLQVSISDLYWQTSWPMDHRRWIAPDLYLPPSFAAYAAGRDPALEAVLAYPG